MGTDASGARPAMRLPGVRGCGWRMPRPSAIPSPNIQPRDAGGGTRGGIPPGAEEPEGRGPPPAACGPARPSAGRVTAPTRARGTYGQPFGWSVWVSFRAPPPHQPAADTPRLADDRSRQGSAVSPNAEHLRAPWRKCGFATDLRRDRHGFLPRTGLSGRGVRVPRSRCHAHRAMLLDARQREVFTEKISACPASAHRMRSAARIDRHVRRRRYPGLPQRRHPSTPPRRATAPGERIPPAAFLPAMRPKGCAGAFSSAQHLMRNACHSPRYSSADRFRLQPPSPGRPGEDRRRRRPRAREVVTKQARRVGSRCASAIDAASCCRARSHSATSMEPYSTARAEGSTSAWRMRKKRVGVTRAALKQIPTEWNHPIARRCRPARGRDAVSRAGAGGGSGRLGRGRRTVYARAMHITVHQGWVPGAIGDIAPLHLHPTRRN